MEIEIKITFFGGKGHCNVTIIPSDYETTHYAESGSYLFELEKGFYDIELQGVSAERVELEVIDADGNLLAEKEIKKEGNFMRSLDLDLNQHQ
jgi:hypothetical protein